MSSEHTPQPWTVHHFVSDSDFKPEDAGLYEIEEANERINGMRECGGKWDDWEAEAEANKRLISTAPDGLHLARSIRNHFEYYGVHNKDERDLYAIAVGLVAKAEGR